MITRIIFLLALTISLVSCQFTETMVLNEDGSGRMSVDMDLREMMAFAGEMEDSTLVKTDTVISFKQIFEEKKDSIAKLSKEEQARLKKMENYNLAMQIKPEDNIMLMSVFIDFKKVGDANDLMKGFSQVGDKMPGTNPKGDNKKEDSSDSNDFIGVNYSFKKGVFKRDAYIKDVKKHRVQVDSMKSTEMFMESIKYNIKYTFPRPIKKSSVKDAVFSEDKKTIMITRRFIDYFKNPDILDIEIELEK